MKLPFPSNVFVVMGVQFVSGTVRLVVASADSYRYSSRPARRARCPQHEKRIGDLKRRDRWRIADGERRHVRVAFAETIFIHDDFCVGCAALL